MEPRTGEAGSREDRTPPLEYPNVSEARIVEGYRIWLRFADGIEGIADLSGLVGQGVFAAWEDAAFFKLMRVDPDIGTVTWPGELDLAPDALYERIAFGRPLPSEDPAS